MEPCVSCIYLTYCIEYVWKSSLWIGRVYFKELLNEQEYYWPTINRAGAAVVSTITSYKITKKVRALWLAERCVCMRVCKHGFDARRVKGGMSLRNGMWHGLRNDIIMRNLICGKWRKEINLTGKHACASAAPFLAPIWRSNRFAGPFITAFKARLKLKHSWYTK